VVDPKSTIRAILYYPQEVGRNIDEVIRIVRAFRISDEQKAAIPANWPNNELIGSDLIIPPPSDINDTEARLKEYECFDWWFCHKKYH